MNLIDELVEVTLPSQESFLKIKETLTRIGIASKKEQDTGGIKNESNRRTR